MNMSNSENFTKDQLVEVFKDAGFSDDDMHRWHIAFGKRYPAVHQEFLEHIHVPENEIEEIREWSKA